MAFSFAAIQLQVRWGSSADAVVAWISVGTLVLLMPLSHALVFACSLAALHQVILGHRWSVERMLSDAARAFVPLLCLQLIVDTLAQAGKIVASLPGSREWLLQDPRWLMDATIYLSYALALALLFVGWIIVSEQVGWVEACRRNFALWRRFAVPLLILIVRTAAILMPLGAVAELIRGAIGGSVGIWSYGVIRCALDTLLLLIVGGVYVRLSRIARPAEAAAAPEAVLTA